jgi:hypothetical protein
MKPVKNSVSRIWTITQVKQLKSEASEGGYVVTQTDGITEIYDPEKDEIIFRALNAGRTELVRLNTFYFEPINN